MRGLSASAVWIDFFFRRLRTKGRLRRRSTRLSIFFQNPDPEPRPVQIIVNEGAPITLSVAPTGSCCVVPRTIRVTLIAGGFNTIEFGDPDTRAPDVDRIVIADP